MKKILVSVIILILLFTACQKYDGEVKKETTKLENIETDYSFKTLDEVREEISGTMKQAQEGRWSNLKFDKFEPVLSDIDELYNIQIKRPGNYKGLEREEILDEEIRIIEHYFPDTLKGTYVDYTGVLENEEYKGDTIEELRRRMKDEDYEGTEAVNPRLYYWQRDGILGHRKGFITIDSGFRNVRVDYGKIGNTWADWQMSKGTSPEGIQIPGLSIWFCEMVDLVFPGNTDGSLDKKYKLLDGEMSIREGIEFVENYMNNELPYETNPAIKAKVQRVDVMEVTDDVYAFHFSMSREIYGMLTESGWPVMTGESGHLREMFYVEIIETDKIDVMAAQLMTDNIEKTSEAITKIISLEEAIDIVSKEIGVNSSYNVDYVELGVDVIGDSSVGGKGKPVWRFWVHNDKSEYSMLFTVDVVTGELLYREL